MYNFIIKFKQFENFINILHPFTLAIERLDNDKGGDMLWPKISRIMSINE